MHWLHEGDADTKFFHLHANHQRKKNYISTLQVEGSTLVSTVDKADRIKLVIELRSEVNTT